MSVMKYQFNRPAEDNYVDAANLYQIADDVRCGFLTEENRTQAKRLQIPELNSGMDAVYWLRGQAVSRLVSDDRGCFAAWDGEGEIPVTFVTDVAAEGNYQVKVTVTAEQAIDDAMIYLGRRRLAWRGSLAAGECFEGTFLANICPIVPRTYSDAMEDLTLDVTVIGRGLHLTAVEAEPWQGPTLYIAGDSTVTDQSADYPYLPGSSYCGWGQMISAYLGMQMAVSNHSHSGLTTESFRSEGHYDILIDRIKDGDICLFQFGHNDQKLMHLMADGGYRDNLVRYIREIKEKGAKPVLVTPLARNSWKGNDGSYNDLLEPFDGACTRLAKETGIPVLHLHQKSMDFVTAQGREAAKRFFFPSDYTHSNDYGAYLFAGYVYEEMAANGLADGKTPSAWMPPEELPALTIPEEYANMENPDAEHLFENLERPQDNATRTDALELVITAMHFFPTNVYNDMFEDVIGHELYAGTVECAYQNGLIPDEMVEDGKLHPDWPVTGGEFIKILRNGYQSRKSDAVDVAAITPEDFDEKAPIARGVAAEICKKLHI